MSDIKQVLRDFVATSNSGKYATEDEVFSKFPELKNYDRQLLKDFVATSNSGKYATEDEVFAKFPEFNVDVKKKDQFRFDLESGSRPTQPTSGSKTSQFKPQKFGEFAPLETKKEENKIEFAGALPESEQKAIDILSQKPNLKFVEDEDLKAYIRQNPKAWTEELIKKNPSLKDQTIDGVLPGLMDEEPTLDNQGLKSIENANTLIDYTKSYDEAFDNMPKESDAFSDDDVKANPKKYRDAVMNDYLAYLKMVNGEDSQTYLDVKERLDYYNSLGDKLYNDSAYADDLKRYQDIQKQALVKVSNNSYSKSIAIENNYDWKYFSKKASNLDVKARNIEKQISELGIEEGKALSTPQKKKYEELMNQYSQVKQEFDKLSEETNITPEVIDQIRSQQGRMSSVMNTIDFIDNDKSSNAEMIRQYKAEMEANKKAQEEFYNTQDDSNLEATGKGVARLGQQAAKTFVNGIFDIAKMPSIVGEAFGAKGYGWSDKLSETAENINSVVELYNPELDKSNFSGFMSLMNNAGQGLGSIAQFATAGSGASKIAKGLQLSEKGLMTANRAAQFTAAASTSTAGLYNNLIDAGFTPEEAARYGLGGGIVMGAAEMIVPEDELIKNTVKQSFISAVKSGATRKEAIENALGHLAKKSAQIVANSGKETFEEGVGSLAESMSKEVASTMTGKKIDGIWDLKNFNSDALAGGQTAFILEMFKFGPRRGRYSNPFEEDLVGYLADNYNEMVETLSSTHPEDYDKIADRYKKLKDIYDGLKNTPSFNNLSKTDQNHVLAQAHAKQVILENIKQSGLSKEGFKDEISSIDEDIFQTLNGLRSKDTWVDKSKTQKENAVQEPSTEEVLPREQGTTPETGGQPQGVGQSVQGEVVAQEGQEVSQEGLTPEQQVSQDAGDVIAEINPPSTLAASVYPVIGEIETAIENNQPVNEEQLTDAENKLYSLLDEIDSRQDLTPDQKQRMANVIENRITKLQNYDNRTRTETSTTTQAVAAGRVEKTQKPNERATIPVRTVAEEGIDVTYDGRPGRVELRDGQYVFVPKKLGAVQARPIVIGEAAQVNANSSFAGVENPTKGQNNSVANITLPNGSTLAILNDDLSIDIGLEIAKKEIGAAPQSLFDVVFDEVVSEQKKEVPVQKKEEAQVETTEQVEQPTQEAQQPVQEARTEQAAPYTGVTPADRSLKQKYKDDSRKRRVLDQAQRIANAIGSDVPIFIHETTDDYNSALSERGLEMSRDSSNGKFVYSEDGSVKEIHINLSEANERTIAHEAAHAVLFKAFGDNQALFLDFKDRLANILQDSTVKELEAFANNAAYVSQGVSAEEFLAELAGKMTAEGNRIPKTTLQKIAKLINEFVGKITKGKVKVFEDTANTADVIDFFNSMADAFAKGKLMDTKSQKIVNTSSELKSKNRLGGIFEADLMSESDLKKLEDEGYLIQNAKIEELDGETVISMFPDNKMVGDLSYGTYNEDTEVDGIQYKKGDKRIVLQGNGGLHFALKYNKDGTFWASTPVLAERFKNVVNKIFDKYPGKSVKVVVFKSTDFKVLSSRDGMAAAMDIIEAAVQDGDIPLSVFRSALNNAVKEEQDKEGIKLFSGKLSAKQLHTTIKDYFINANDKSFKKRIDVGKSIISGVFGSQDENINFENLSKKLDIPLNKSGKINIKDATPRLGNVQEESLMENVPVESAVAYIEIPSKLIIEDESNIAPKDRKHISYPGVMKTEDGQRVTVHMLSERDNYKDILSSVNDGEIKTSEKIEDNIPLRDLKHGANHAGARNIPYSIVKINTKLKSKSQQNLVEKAGMSSRMTEDDQGNYLFYHFSPTKISSIDPKYFGRNVNRTGRDERPGLNISMYYTEPGVKDVSGDYGYVVRIPKDQVYPFNKDPLDLYDKAKAEFNKKFPGQAFDPNKQVAFIAKEAAKLGYPMTVAKWANNKLRAQTTEKMQGEYYTKPEKGGGISVNPEIEQFEVNQKARRKALKAKNQLDINPDEIQNNSEPILNEVINGDPESGATFNLDGTKYDDGGLVIPITSVNVNTDEISTEDISDMVENNTDKIFDDKKVKVGIYKFPDGKQISVDLNIIVPSKNKEFALEFGRAAGQESIFNLDDYTNLKTGSTGENPIEFTSEEFLEIAQALNEGRLPNIDKLEYKPEFKSKSQEAAIPKAKAQESSMVSEMNQAMNKTGLAKENAVKRFIEKYGQNGLVAKEIIDNFDKIQEQLGITKICNI